MLTVHNRRNFGLKLLRWGRYQVELWFCLVNIPAHVHRSIDSTVVFLGGSMIGYYRGVKTFTWRDIFSRYTIPRGMPHAAAVARWCLFLNIERWHSDNITSAALDFYNV